MKRRFLSTLMALVLALSLIPTAALAEEGNPVQDLEGNSYETLKEAVEDSKTDLILTDDISLDHDSWPQDSFTLDLGGHTITMTLGVSKKGVHIPEGKTFVLKNGKIVANNQETGEHSVFVPDAGAAIELKGITMTTNGTALYPAGNAAEVKVVNSSISAGTYAIGTNASMKDGDLIYSSNVKITLQSSKISTQGSNGADGNDCTILLNVPGTLDIDDCTITGHLVSVLVRGGTATIQNSTINLADIYKGNDAHNYDENWGSGNAVPMAALVVGNQSVGAYKYSADCTLINTKINALEGPRGIYVYGIDNGDRAATLTITGENSAVTVKSDIDSIMTGGEGQAVVTGGTFSSDVSAYVAPNYECVGGEQSGYTVKKMEDKLVVSGNVSTSGDETTVSGTLEGNFSSNGRIQDSTDSSIGTGGEPTTEPVTNDVEVNLTTTDAETKATTTTLNVTADTAKSLGAATSLTVKTDAGDVTFDNAALRKMGTGDASDVVITVTDSSDDYESDTNVKAAYTVTATSNSSPLLPYGETNNGTVTITVPTPEGYTQGTTEAWYVTGSGDDIRYVEKLTPVLSGAENEYVEVTIGHLSTIAFLNSAPTTGVVVAAVVDENGNYVETYTDLQAALNAAAEDSTNKTVKLLRDIEVSNQSATSENDGVIVVPDGVILDGNGKTITATNWQSVNNAKTSNHILSVNGGDESEPTTTIKNLTIVGMNGDVKSKAGVNAYNGANVVLEDVNISNCGSAGVQVNGATVEINRGTIKDNSWGGVNVDAKVDQDSQLTVNDATILDTTSIYVEHAEASSGKKMEVAVNGGTYQNIEMKDEGKEGDTITITGAEVASVTNASEGGKSTVSVIDSTITGTAPDADDNVTVVNCKDSNGNAISNVVPEGTVATWVTADGTVNSGTLDNAFDALKTADGGTIYLTGDATLGKNPWVTDEIIIYGQGHTITANIDGSSGTVYALTVYEGGSLTLDNTNLNITGTDQSTEYGIDVYHGGELILNQSNVDIKNVSRATISSSKGNEKPGIFTLDHSTFTASDIGGSFSNGGDWTVNNSTVTINDCTNHGLSVSSLEVTNSQINISNTGDFAIYGNSVTLGAGADVTVDNCGTTFPRTGWDGTEYRSPVQVKDETGNSFQVEQGAELKIQNCKNKDTQAANNTIYIPADTTYTNNGNVDATVIVEEPASGSHTVTVMNGTQTVAVATVANNGTYTLPTAPAAPGANYTFAWVCNGMSYAAGVPVTVTGDMTFYAHWTYNGSTGGNGGGSSEPSYSPVIDITGNGDVKVNPRTPSEGDEVTITPDPDNGYEVGEVTVTDRSGDAVRVTANRDGTYTFTQPRGRVTIQVTFVRAGESAFFDDVPASFWAYDEIAWAYDNGYVNGTSATTFSPNSSITRQQVWMILARLSGGNPASMAAAREWAMVNGISDGTNPGNAVTRQQLVALLYRYAQMMGYDNGAREALSSFPDAGTVSGYAQEPMQWSVANGIVAGTSAGTLNPAGTATRAQFAVILYRFWDQVG